MKTEPLLLMEQEEPIVTQWWEHLDSNTHGPQGQKDNEHGTRSITHSNISNDSGGEDYPVG